LLPEDAKVSFDWRNDPEIWRFTQKRPVGPITEQVERDWILQVIDESTSIRMAICLKASNRYIGNVQVTDIEERTGHFHIFIGDSSLWGLGYAYEGAVLMLEHISRNTSLSQLACWIHRQNERSLRLHEKLGFLISGQDSDGNYLLTKTIVRSDQACA
jgi:RimJ/RimL family protein N-acetyltransferase